jgi:hypothetical protein
MYICQAFSEMLKMLKPLAVAAILIFNTCSSTTPNERERLAFGSCFHLTGMFSRLIYVLDSISMTS